MKNLMGLLFFCLVATGAKAQTSKLLFFYDEAGNQRYRYYCQSPCILKSETPETVEKEAAKEDEPIAAAFDDKIVMYPNPTDGIMQLQWGASIAENLQSIELINYLGVTIQNKDVSKNTSVNLDLSTYPTGVYIARFRFSDHSNFTRQIIKK